MRANEKRETWEKWRDEEIARARAVLALHHYSLDDKQVHVSGERFLVSGRKLVLTGVRNADNLPVIIKFSSDLSGIAEIRDERHRREMLRDIHFAYHTMRFPEEILWHEGPTSLTLGQLGGDEQSDPAHADDPRQRAEPIHQTLPLLLRAKRNVLPLHDVEDGERSTSGQRLAAKRGGVIAGFERGGDVAPGPTRSDRHPVAERLGQRDHIGPHVVTVFEAEPSTSPTESGLHFVHHQERLALVAERAHRLQVTGGRGLHATLTLDRLEQHGTHALVHRRRERIDVRELDLTEPGRQRLEGFLLLGLTGGRKGGQGPTVKRVVGGKNVESFATTVGLAVTARQLDRALVGLGAGVGEEHLTGSSCRRGEQEVEALRELGLALVEIEVRDVQQRAGLIGDRVGDGRMRVTE